MPTWLWFVMLGMVFVALIAVYWPDLKKVKQALLTTIHSHSDSKSNTHPNRKNHK